ncbi:hypothetical protein ACHAXS_006058 [Conticribra weissflogii]
MDFDDDKGSMDTWHEEDDDDDSEIEESEFVGQAKQPIIDFTPLLANSNNQNNPDIAYFYLRDTLGLSEETMWKITLDAGSLLGMTPRNLDKKVSLLRRTMNLSDEDVRVILGKQPALLHYSAERNLAPTILFLVRALDLSKGELRAMIMECPSILGYSLGNLNKKLGFFLNTLRFDDTGQVRELLVDTPKLLLCAVDTGLVPRMKFLHKEIQFSLEELRRVYLKNPKLLLYSVDDNLREKIVFFFILQLNMEPKHVRKLLLSFPQVMDYSLENHLVPIAYYFMTELEFSSIEVRSIVLKFPRLFTNSLFKIKHVTGFLRYELQLDANQVKRVLFQAPQVLGLNAEGNLKQKIEFLRSRLKLTDDELGVVLSKMPTLLGCKYLESALLSQSRLPTKSPTILKDTILKQPSLLGYSLDSRIRPRMERLMKAEVPLDKITVGISMTEKKFQEWLSSSESREKRLGIARQYGSTALGYLSDKLNFGVSEIEFIRASLPPECREWGVNAIHARINYLREALGVSLDELRDLLLAYPLLLDISSDSVIKERFNKLRRAGLSIKENLQNIIYNDRDFEEMVKPLLHKQRSSSKSNISFLRKVLQLNEKEERMLVSHLPSLEKITNRKALEDRVDYFVKEFNNSVKSAKSAILKHPTLLELSFPRVVLPRMEKINSFRVSDFLTTAQVLAMPDDEFEYWCRVQCIQKVNREFPKVVQFMRTSLQLNQDEMDSVLTQVSSEALENYNAEKVISFLLTLASVERVKAAVIRQPYLLSTQVDQLQDKTNKRKSLLQSVGDWSDAFFVATMTNDDFRMRLSLMNVRATLKHYLDMTDIQPELVFCSEDEFREYTDDRIIVLHHPSSASAADRLKLITMGNKSFTRFRYREATKEMLRGMLDLSNEDFDFVLSRANRLGTWDPNEFLKPKIDFMLQQFNGSKRAVRDILLDNPRLFDYSLRRRLIPRMTMLRDLGLPLDRISGFVMLTENEIQRRHDLKSRLNLTDVELDKVVPPVLWAEQRNLRQNIQRAIEFLTSKTNNNTELLKQILLNEPSLLTLSFTTKIRPIVNLLLESGHSANEIPFVVNITQNGIELMKTKSNIYMMLEIDPKEGNSLLGDVIDQASPQAVMRRFDFLLSHVFTGSVEELKASLINEPFLLTVPVRKLRARLNILNFLKSLGLESSPNDVAALLVRSKTELTKELIPEMKHWYSRRRELISGASSDVFRSEDSVARRDDVILAMLESFKPSINVAHFDDVGRENAEVIYWK